MSVHVAIRNTDDGPVVYYGNTNEEACKAAESAIMSDTEVILHGELSSYVACESPEEPDKSSYSEVDSLGEESRPTAIEDGIFTV